jgi:hypothetical protein
MPFIPDPLAPREHNIRKANADFPEREEIEKQQLGYQHEYDTSTPMPDTHFTRPDNLCHICGVNLGNSTASLCPICQHHQTKIYY